MKIIKYVTCLCSVILFGFFVSSSYATVSLSILPVDGSSSLRFARLDGGVTDKEVRLRITATDNRQYQVYQRMVSPLTNARGESLTRSALSVSALPGSNTAGTLYVQNLESVTFSDQLIYTSTNEGTSDGFTLFYRIDPAQVTASGNFTGEILYSVRQVGGNTQEEFVLNVFLDVPETLTITSRASSRADRVRLQTEHSPTEGESYEIDIRGNLGKKLNIYQDVVQYPINDEGAEFNPQGVKFLVVPSSAGESEFPTATELPRARQLIYSTSSEQDNVEIQFKLDPKVIENLQAGEYRGQIRYSVEGEAISQPIDVPLEISVTPVFKLDVQYPAGGVSFNKLLPDSAPQEKELLVTVKTNLGKPYSINQNVQAPLANEKGEEMPLDYFSIKEEIQSSDKKGQIKYPEFAPVSSGESILYHSDPQGTPVQVKIIYRQVPYPGMKPGDYKTSIIYSLEQN